MPLGHPLHRAVLHLAVDAVLPGSLPGKRASSRQALLESESPSQLSGMQAACWEPQLAAMRKHRENGGPETDILQAKPSRCGLCPGGQCRRSRRAPVPVSVALEVRGRNHFAFLCFQELLSVTWDLQEASGTWQRAGRWVAGGHLWFAAAVLG